MQACTPLCMVRPLWSHLTCRTQKCAGVCWWSMSSSLSEGLAAGSQIQFNPAHFHQCAVLPRVVLRSGAVRCGVLYCSSGSGSGSKLQQGLSTAVSLVARTPKMTQRECLDEATEATEATETGRT